MTWPSRKYFLPISDSLRYQRAENWEFCTSDRHWGGGWNKIAPVAWPVRNSSSHVEFSPSLVVTLLLEEMRNTLEFDYVPALRVIQEMAY